MNIEQVFGPDNIRFYREKRIWADETFADLLHKLVKSDPEREAITDGRTRLTYRELDDGINKVAALLRRHGLDKGDFIAVQIPNWIEFVLIYFAIERIGAIGIPISVDFRSREVEYVLRTANCRGLICCRSFKNFDHLEMINKLRPSLPHLTFIGVVRGSRDGNSDAVEIDEALSATSSPNDFVPVATNPDDIMRMMFTSGTTGNPKGVTHNHNTSLWPARMLNKDMDLGSDEVMLLYLPLALNWGYLTVLQTVMAGCRLVLMENFDARKALEIIETEKVTYIPTAPAAIVALLNAPNQEKYDLSSLRTVITGGTSCPVELVRKFQRRLDGNLIELYGMLECGGYHTYTRREDDPESVAGSVGKPGTEMKLRICSTGGSTPVTDGEVGEIQSAGPSIQLGYFGDEDANAKSYTDDGWFRSGDLGMIDPDGNLRIVGRLKEMINRGGKKYYPREVEEILYTHPKILHAAIIGLPDERLGESNCLCVVAKNDQQKPTLKELVDFLKDTIATYKLPERLEFFDELPFTPTGKIQRHVLMELVQSR
ncbi:AMP-binding protein [Sneathiella chungangensis]|uniref:3-methylmercaptopropionyl-CoA ligase n=1 Tax=Sneathiella chungangensis TaxID=1418234 RepID=A0A845MFH1_9PROT|nr:class I adenylate-forming enzyme family protein [Sneathiella chungangensis]MZR22793.1 AMP-binding protein [Sneathiella chungangensis]